MPGVIRSTQHQPRIKLRQIHYKRFSRAGSARVKTRVSIVRKAGIKRCTLHNLRGTFASQLAVADVNEALIQKTGRSRVDKHNLAVLHEHSATGAARSTEPGSRGCFLL